MKWADKFKKKTPEPTEEQVQAKNKETLDVATVVKAELVEQKEQKPEGVAPTPPQKFTSEYDSIDKIMEQVEARRKANGEATEYSAMPTEADVKRQEALAQYQGSEEILKSGKSFKESPEQPYGTIPDLTPKDLQSVLYETTNGNQRVASYIENQIDKVAKDMSEVTIKTKEGVKIDSFQPSIKVINEELQNPDKAEKFGKAMESAAKEPDLAKQDKIIKDAVKEVVQGHKTDLRKQMDKLNQELASNIYKDAKYTSTNKDLPETAKARPTGRGK